MLFSRRAGKIATFLASAFTAAFVYLWPQYFGPRSARLCAEYHSAGSITGKLGKLAAPGRDKAAERVKAVASDDISGEGDFAGCTEASAADATPTAAEAKAEAVAAAAAAEEEEEAAVSAAAARAARRAQPSDNGSVSTTRPCRALPAAAAKRLVSAAAAVAAANNVKSTDDLNNNSAAAAAAAVPSAARPLSLPALTDLRGTRLRFPAPSFDGRAVCYPTDRALRDYLSWRQADCTSRWRYLE